MAKIFPEWSGYKPARDASNGLYNFFAVTRCSLKQFDTSFSPQKFWYWFFQNIVDEQIKTFDESHERHFVDMYVNKMREAEADPNNETYFSCKYE